MKNSVKSIIVFLLTNLILGNYSFAQNSVTSIDFDPDEILVGDRKRPAVLLVGTFHFAYPNQDAHVTKEEDQVNVYTPKRQEEIKQLVEYLAKFKPTKIAVETGKNTGYIMNEYRSVMAGTEARQADEVSQLMYPLMEQFELDTIYGVDASSLAQDFSKHPDSATFRPFVEKIFEGYDFRSDDEIAKLYSKMYEEDDKIVLENSLVDYFQLMNSDKVLERGFGAYLNGDFTNGDHEGADAYTLYWYSRNIRIFRNIQKITTSPDDRILVLFGAGHIEILKQLMESTPQYDYIPYSKLK